MLKLFLSYCRDDARLARNLDKALSKRGLSVWLDERSIAPGERWPDAVERGLRDSRGVIVLISSASAHSEWVTFEYALAVGARLPVIAVRVKDARIPAPIQRFQVVDYSDARVVAKRIDEGILEQSRAAGQERASTPTLMAKFQEKNGKIALASRVKPPDLWMELWMEQVPTQTKHIAFEIMDIGFRDRKWTMRRPKRMGNSVREFVTDDMHSYGDVEICARGTGSGIGNWSATSRLHEALVRYYSGRPTTAEIRHALKQIRIN